jgi:hypothetical protein
MRVVRAKWLNVEPLKRGDLGKFFDMAKEREFGRSTPSGYILDNRRTDCVSGRFIQREEISEEVEDPFGRVDVLTRTIYHVTKFVLRDSAPQLELQDYPRRLSAFLLQLGEAFDFHVSAVEVTCNVQKWASGIAKELSNPVFRLVEVHDVSVARDATAKMVFTGIGDIPEKVSTFLGKRSYQLTRVGFSGLVGEDVIRCQCSADGHCSVSGPIADDFVATLRRTLKSALT